MRYGRLPMSGYGYLDLKTLGDAAAAAPYVPPPPAMPAERQLALLKLRRTEAAQDCVAHLEAHGLTCGEADYRALFAENLVLPDPRGGYVLTPMGHRRAETLARSVASDLGLHHFRIGQSRFEVTAFCTCGFSAAASKNRGHCNAALQRAVAAHRKAVADGTYQPPRSVEEIMRSVDPSLFEESEKHEGES